MIKLEEQNLIQILLEAGSLQSSIAANAKKIALSSQETWEIFIKNLIGGGRDFPDIIKAHNLLTTAISDYNRILNKKLNVKKVFNYFAAKVIRSIVFEQYELENQWYRVCSLTEISHPGEFLCVQIFQESLVAVRQLDNTVRVFLNVCPHRQAQILEGKGCLSSNKQIRCPYHGWLFGLDGQCKNVPGATLGEFGDFTTTDYHLQDLETEFYKNSVFVRLRGDEGSNRNKFSNDTTSLKLENLFTLDCSQNIGAIISELFQSVYPGCNDVKSPEIPEEIRLLLKIGYLEKELKQVCIRNSTRQQISCEVLSLDRACDSELGYLNSLIIELKQSILSLNKSSLKLNFNNILLRNIGKYQEKSTFDESTFKLDLSAHPLEDLDKILQPRETRKTLPIWVYGNPELFVIEVDKIIKSTWQFVCHESEVPEPGNFTYLDIVGERAYVIRTSDGELFAGKLKAIDEAVSPPYFSPPNYGLEPIDIDIWLGFVFIRFSKDGPKVASVWENPNLLTPYKLKDIQPLFGGGWYDFDVEADYKIIWENFLENYHFPTSHQGLSRLCQILRNSSLLPLYYTPSSSLTPVELKYIQNLKLAEPHSLQHEEHLREIADHRKLLPEALHYTVFGSIADQRKMPIMFGLLVFPEHIQAMSFIPVGPQACHVRVRSYGLPLDINTSYGQAMQEARIANVEDIQIKIVEEDIKLNYLTQAGVSSNLFKKQGILGNMEISVAHFQEKIRTEIPVTRCLHKPKKGTLYTINDELKLQTSNIN